MRSIRRPVRSTIHYHGREAEASVHSVIFSINGIRWQYTLPAQTCDDIEYMVKHVSVGKAFAHAKHRAVTALRLDADLRQATLLRHRGAQAARAKRMKVTLPNV